MMVFLSERQRSTVCEENGQFGDAWGYFSGDRAGEWTVIGAMLIALLMTPVLAVAAAVVTGQRNRALYSLLVVIGGVAGAVIVALILGEIYRSGVISMSSNSQIVSRTSPRLVDLWAALGAGAVGALATCRKDIGATLPGAAIAIALVPPLAVVGVALSRGAW